MDLAWQCTGMLPRLKLIVYYLKITLPYKKWEEVAETIPCPPSQEYRMAQPCITRVESEIIVANVYNETFSCTAIFNVNSMSWKIATTQSQLPMGGYLTNGHDPSHVFYVGGIDKTSVFELSISNSWGLTNIKLPFPMSTFDTYFVNSRMNVTKCARDTLSIEI